MKLVVIGVFLYMLIRDCKLSLMAKTLNVNTQIHPCITALHVTTPQLKLGVVFYFGVM